MLLRQNRGRHKIRHLLAVLYRLKGRPDRDLRLAISDVTADQPVHDLPALHVVLDRVDRHQLIFRLIIREHFLKFLLPDGITTVGKSFFSLPLRIQLHEILRDLPHCRTYPRLRPVPLLRTELVQLRRFRCIAVCIFLNHIELRRRHIKAAAPGILDLHVILRHMVDLDFFDAPIDAETMILMHDKVTDGELRKARDLLSLIASALFLFLMLLSENITLRDNDKADQRILISFLCISMRDQYLTRKHLTVGILGIEAVQPLLRKILRQPVSSCTGCREQHDPITILLPALQILYEQLKAVIIRTDRANRQIEGARYGKRCFRIFQCTKTDRIFSGNACRDLLSGKQNTGLPVQHVALFQPMFHALSKFQLDCICTL